MHDHRRTRSGLVKSHRHVLDEKHTLRRLSKVSTRVGGTEGLAQDCRMPSVDGTTTHRSSPRFAAMTATQTDSNPPRFKSIADRLLLGVSEVLLLRRADYSSNTDHIRYSHEYTCKSPYREGLTVNRSPDRVVL